MGGVTWPGNALPSVSFEPAWGEPRECGSPHPVKTTPANSSTHAFPPQPQKKTSHHEGSLTNGPKRNPPIIPFLNPDPIVHLIGQSNNAPIIKDGQRVTALIDWGAQVSSISCGFCEHLALEVHPLGRLLELEGTGGSAIPNLGYIEVNL